MLYRAIALTVLTLATTGIWEIARAEEPAPVEMPAVITPDGQGPESEADLGRNPAAIDGEPVCVTVPKTNLRASPSTAAKVTWIVGRNMPLQRVGREAGWSKVRDLRGQTHWVISKNLSTNESCAVVRVRTAALHKGPGNAERADFRQADRYTPFKKTDREGGWVRLEDEFKGTFWTRDTNVWIPVRRSRMSF